MRNRKALIATLPRSGTLYCQSFFWAYDQLLGRAWDYLEGRFTPDVNRALADGKITHRTTHANTLGLDELFICHTVCPGFGHQDDARMEAWNDLCIPAASNPGEGWLRKLGLWGKCDPAQNMRTRIVYLYRNPLDHFISSWQQAQASGDTATSLHDFVFESGALSAFIRQYYSYRQMSRLYPGHVFMMPYEQLVAKPHEAFRDMLTFIGTPPAGVLRERLFADALAMCSRGTSSGPKEWEAHFTRDEIETIEAVFGAFDMSLSDFTLQEGAARTDLLVWTHAIDPALAARHQHDFFLQQSLNKKQMHAQMHPGFTQWLGQLFKDIGRAGHSLLKHCHSIADEAEV